MPLLFHLRSGISYLNKELGQTPLRYQICQSKFIPRGADPVSAATAVPIENNRELAATSARNVVASPKLLSLSCQLANRSPEHTSFEGDFQKVK